MKRGKKTTSGDLKDELNAAGANSPRLKTDEHGYLVIASTGDTITPEMVKEAALGGSEPNFPHIPRRRLSRT